MSALLYPSVLPDSEPASVSALVGQGATTGLARNPEVQPKLMVFMILGMALAESIAIYGLVISLILLYANPLM